jgi:hypothetical protein
MTENGILQNLSFVKLMRRNVGKYLQIVTRGKFFSPIESYFDVLFPGVMEGNPFTNPDFYKFPYKAISLDYLFLVHQVDERLELLAEADEQKMPYADFLDFVINYVLSKNEEIGRDRYILKNQPIFPFYIIDTDRKEEFKKKRKCKN